MKWSDNNKVQSLLEDLRVIDDHKFTSKFDPERFLSSWQWRMYLEIFNANEFRWNVFVGKQDGNNPNHYTIREFHTLKMHRYPGMRDDLTRAVDNYLGFAERHLPEKFGKVAA